MLAKYTIQIFFNGERLLGGRGLTLWTLSTDWLVQNAYFFLQLSFSSAIG